MFVTKYQTPAQLSLRNLLRFVPNGEYLAPAAEKSFGNESMICINAGWTDQCVPPEESRSGTSNINMINSVEESMTALSQLYYLLRPLIPHSLSIFSHCFCHQHPLPQGSLNINFLLKETDIMVVSNF